MDVATIAIEGKPDFDWLMNGAQLAADDGLKSAVIISLFTDRRAADGDVLPTDDSDRRGWFGDDYSPVDGDQIGSHLWLLSREKQRATTLERARAYAAAALSWLKEDGIARSIEVQASWVRPEVLQLEIQIARPNGTTARYRFENFWSQSNGV